MPTRASLELKGSEGSGTTIISKAYQQCLELQIFMPMKRDSGGRAFVLVVVRGFGSGSCFWSLHICLRQVDFYYFCKNYHHVRSNYR